MSNGGQTTKIFVFTMYGVTKAGGTVTNRYFSKKTSRCATPHKVCGPIYSGGLCHTRAGPWKNDRNSKVTDQK